MIDVFLYLDDIGYHDIHFIVIGEVDEIYANHKRLHMVGYVDSLELPTWYRTADIFLFLRLARYLFKLLISPLSIYCVILVSMSSPEIENKMHKKINISKYFSVFIIVCLLL